MEAGCSKYVFCEHLSDLSGFDKPDRSNDGKLMNLSGKRRKPPFFRSVI